jgi:hypothetical protein
LQAAFVDINIHQSRSVYYCLCHFRTQVMDSRSKTLDRCADLALLWGVAIAPLLLASTFSIAGADLTIGTQGASLRVCYQILQEFVGLGVLAYLLWRQGRHLADIGLTFQISDVPKSLVIAFVAYVGFAMVYFALPQGATDSSMTGGPAVLTGLVSVQLVLLIGLTAVNPCSKNSSFARTR